MSTKVISYTFLSSSKTAPVIQLYMEITIWSPAEFCKFACLKRKWAKTKKKQNKKQQNKRQKNT